MEQPDRSKEIEDLNTTINQSIVTDIYRTLYQQQQHAYSSQGHMGHFSG